MNVWQKEIMGFKPENEFTPLNDTSWIQRRNIKPISDDMWSCEYRILNEKEYQDAFDEIVQIKRIIADLTDTAKYEEGYNAAMILLGREA